MSQIHFIGGEKGGIGKSLLARMLAQHFADRGLPFVGFDSDRSHGALLRHHGSATRPLPLDTPDGFDRIVDAAAEDPQRRVLVDLAAQTQAALLHWLEEGGVAGLAAELGVALRYWHVMDNGRDGAELLGLWLDGAAAALPLVVVLNEVRGADFALAESRGLLDRAQRQGAQLLRLPRLGDAPLQQIEAAGHSFGAAQQPGALSLMDRQRLRVWLQRAGDEFDRIGV